MASTNGEGGIKSMSYTVGHLDSCLFFCNYSQLHPRLGQIILCDLPAAAKSLQSCPTLWDPIDSSPPGSLSLGFSRQERWSGLPFLSPKYESEKWKRSRSVVSDSSRPHGLQATRLLHPWGFPGKSTGVGCHCLLWLLPTPVTKPWPWNKPKISLYPTSSRCHFYAELSLQTLQDMIKMCGPFIIY